LEGGEDTEIGFIKKKPPKEKSIHAARKHGAILIGESWQDII
jgi:hypothetical protein